VDGVGRVETLEPCGAGYTLRVATDVSLAPYLVDKGSIAVDGISLTVAGLDDRHFDVMIIPFTWAHTNLASVRTGDRVNLECDVVGKYIARMAEVLARQS
jgi:riboflavin synthase